MDRQRVFKALSKLQKKQLVQLAHEFKIPFKLSMNRHQLMSQFIGDQVGGDGGEFFEDEFSKVEYYTKLDKRLEELNTILSDKLKSMLLLSLVDKKFMSPDELRFYHAHAKAFDERNSLLYSLYPEQVLAEINLLLSKSTTIDQKELDQEYLANLLNLKQRLERQLQVPSSPRATTISDMQNAERQRLLTRRVLFEPNPRKQQIVFADPNDCPFESRPITRGNENDPQNWCRHIPNSSVTQTPQGYHCCL
jgi:hypothetical protein